jgi:sugar phosphate isomerase/epimerase
MKNRILITLVLLVNIFNARSQEIGVQLYSVRNEIKKDLNSTLKQVRSMGIKELEGGELYGMDLKSYKKMLDQMGYKMISIGIEYSELDKDLTPIIEKAKALGATYITCFWIPHQGNSFSESNINAAAALFNKAGKVFQENGLQFCYHPHGYEFRPGKNGTLFDDLVAKTNPSYINFELDVFWAKQGCDDPVALLKKYPKRFLLLHLKDRQIGTVCDNTGQANEESNVVLGKGDVNIKEIMRAAKKSSVKHYFIEDESSRVMKQLPLSLQYLKSLN